MTRNSDTDEADPNTEKPVFSEDWKNWIRTNVEAGCDKNGIFRILSDEGFDYDRIKDALNFEPAVALDQIINPLKQASRTQTEVVAETGGGSVAGAMPHIIPNAERLELDGIEFYVIEGFLNRKECDQIVALIKAHLRPSGITTTDEPDKYYRTSSTCDLGLLDDVLVKDIDRRICAIMGLDPAFSESIQGQHYEVGQEFKAHTDFFEGNELAEYGGAQGQRSYTFMIYLNDVEDGGETSFPNLKKTIVPIRGRAVVWNSLDGNGMPNQNSLHRAHPVKKGSKTVITKWFRTRDGLPVFSREENENIPNYTEIGFKKSELPKKLFRKITKFYRQNLSNQVSETVPGDFILSTGESASGSSMVELPETLRQEIHACLKPRVEAWSGLDLESTFVYGIRVYHDGAVLKEHRDRLGTHTFGVIINVDQDVNEDWPLSIEDSYYRRHEVILRPGEVIYYEGARLLHGRPTPLNGTGFANIFCHFKPHNG